MTYCAEVCPSAWHFSEFLLQVVRPLLLFLHVLFHLFLLVPLKPK